MGCCVKFQTPHFLLNYLFAMIKYFIKYKFANPSLSFALKPAMDNCF